VNTDKNSVSSNYATLDQVFERFHYPAGESHIRLRDGVDLSALETIEAEAHSFDDLAQIVTADRILRRNKTQIRWFVPYFPFARHDRRNDLGDGFELQLALELVSELDLVIADPHSEVAAQLPHFSQTDCVAALRSGGAFANDPVVVIPDAGAAKKAYDWIAKLDKAEVVQAQKQRDVATGELSGFSIPVKDLQGRPCIIVDDICDGGGTFLGLAQQLAAANAGPLTLVVTHGLFTKGVSALLEHFSAVYCLKPDAQEPIDGVTSIPFSELYAGGTIR